MNAGQPPFDRPSDSLPPEGPPLVISVQLPAVRPVATYALAAVCIVAFLLQLAGQFLAGGDLLALLGAKINTQILRGELWRLITPVFLHASLTHIAFNMYGLIRFGPPLERYYGHGRFLVLFLLSGFSGNVASFILTPVPSLGSSTAIFGLLGAEMVFLYQNRKLFGKQVQADLLNLFILAGYNLLTGFVAASLIDNWGHVGGLIGGTLFAWFGGPQLVLKGLPPLLKIEDERDWQQVLLAAWGGFFLSGLLTGVTIVWRLWGK